MNNTSKLKIAIIAPAYPYRGGIAHHSNMLTKYLRKQANVDIITFTRQYPKLLYPGQSQEEVSQDAEFQDINSERMIDSVNPINWYKVGRLLSKRNYDLVIFKFWLPFFGTAFGTIAKIIKKKSSAKIMIVCENLIPHEKRIGDKWLTDYLFRHCDLAITQSSVVQKQLNNLYPSIPQIMLPHPVYENFGEQINKAEARKRLSIGFSKVLLFFGFVREYKGLDLLIEAMPSILAAVPDSHLLVVGEFFGSPMPTVSRIKELGLEQKITLHNQYVPNEDVALWFSASDVLVMPYRNATNSGIVQIGYNFATPSIVTNVGSLQEVVLDGKTGYVVQKAEENKSATNSSKPTQLSQDLANAIAKIFEKDNLKIFSENIIQERKKYSWDNFANKLIEFYKKNVA